MPLDAFTSHLGFEQGRINPKFHTTSYDVNGSVIDGTVAELITQSPAPFAFTDGIEFRVAVDHGPTQTITLDATDFVDITAATSSETATVLERDIGRARIKSSTTEPFAFLEGDVLVLRVSDGADQTATIDPADFADIEVATASEVAAVLDAAFTGATARAIAGRVVIETAAYGIDVALDIVSGAMQAVLAFPTNRITGSTRVVATDDGTDVTMRSELVGALGCLRVFDPQLDNANQALNFSLDEACGTTGGFSFVLGFDTPGHVETLTGGDYVRISQPGLDFATGEVLRVFGSFRIPTSPVGYTWRVTARAGGFDEVIELPSGVFDTFELVDFGINVSQLGGPQPLEFELTLVGAATLVAIEFPAVYLDVVGFAEAGDPAMVLINRIPQPDQTAIPHPSFPNVSLMIMSTNGDAVALADTIVTVDGVVAYNGGAGGFQAGFSGVATVNTGPSSDDARLVIDTSAQTYASSELIVVRVQSATAGASATIDESYSFTIADTIAPELTSASARAKRVVRVVFSEAMSDSVLVASSYTFERLSQPAVEIEAVSVERVSATTVDITLDTEMTFLASYRVTAIDVSDIEENEIVPPDNQATFVGYACPVPAGRDFNLYQMMSEHDRRADTSGDLERLLGVLQEPLDQCLCLLDDWTDILDPDLASDDFVAGMLASLGNPFRFDMTPADNRRLLAVLVAIYQAKGTPFGIIDTIFFFTGIDVEIVPLNDFEGAWILGVGELGDDTLLGASDSAVLYTFEIIVPITLTDDERSKMLSIANYMKVPHEHIRMVEPDDTVTLGIFWILGDSELGSDTILSQVS